jgi:nicotinamidase-related amidase
MSEALALIVIDMAVDFFDRSPALASQRERLVTAINDLTSRVRSAGHAVIWVRQEFKPDLSDAFLDMRRRNISITIEGTEGCRILPELDREPSDLEVVKKRYSAFYGTELDSLLASLRARTLVFAGINSHACVRTAVIDAYQRDYEIILAEDCIGSYDEEHHETSVRYLAAHMTRLLDNAAIGRELSA